jgi:hypothetical protein
MISTSRSTATKRDVAEALVQARGVVVAGERAPGWEAVDIAELGDDRVGEDGAELGTLGLLLALPPAVCERTSRRREASALRLARLSLSI